MANADWERFCVIGAGPCGLTAAKNLLAQGFECDVLERQADLGGNWNIALSHSSVYESTHFISSKRLTEFVDFPMPREYPHYPSHRQALAYLRAYAERFAIAPRIQFNCEVIHASPLAQGWQVQIQGETEPRRYAGLIVANGHHWAPLWPDFPGQFTGEVMHAHAYKSPDIFRGRRVLVVGAGNSGCDIAVEAAQFAEAAWISMRRGYHFLPKFVRGLPIDLRGERLHAWGCPLWLRRWIASVTAYLEFGNQQRYGLPQPDHALFETHPIINSQLIYQLGHGRIHVKPNIKQFAGTTVHFSDGSSEPIDLIVYATGYALKFPFLDPQWVVNSAGKPHLFLNAFHAERDDFLVAGLIQPDSGIWGLADLQCRLFACFQRVLRQAPQQAAWFQREKSQGFASLGNGVNYVDSPRHALEVEYYGYRDRLRRLLQRFGDQLPATARRQR